MSAGYLAIIHLPCRGCDDTKVRESAWTHLMTTYCSLREIILRKGAGFTKLDMGCKLLLQLEMYDMGHRNRTFRKVLATCEDIFKKNLFP